MGGIGSAFIMAGLPHWYPHPGRMEDSRRHGMGTEFRPESGTVYEETSLKNGKKTDDPGQSAGFRTQERTS